MPEDSDYRYWFVAGYGEFSDFDNWTNLVPEGSAYTLEGVEPFSQPFDEYAGDYVLGVVDRDGIAHYVAVYSGWDSDFGIEDAIDEYNWENYE